MTGPFLTVKKAATYCGQSEATFRVWLKLFDLPFCGPLRDVLASSTLDRFMAAPQDFLKPALRPKPYTKGTPSILDLPPAEAMRKILDRKKARGLRTTDAPRQKERPVPVVSDIPGARA